jgi:catechol 2,3-dioxygenase-like lactoylglutathione lyase family enzyme
MAAIKRVGHVVLGVRDPQRSIQFYTETLGMQLINSLEDEQMQLQMAFFSFGERDHDIAIVKVPDDQPVGSSSLAHTALEIEGGEEQLREFYQQLKRSGATVEFTFDHVITKSFYFLDPDGNRLEIFSQQLPAAAAMQTLHEASTLGEVLRPLDLETAPTA